MEQFYDLGSKEAALDFLGPDVAKYMRVALATLPLATGAAVKSLPTGGMPPAPAGYAYRGSPQHYADTLLLRSKALQQAQTPLPAQTAPPTLLARNP
jgi:hypothetical protein